MLAYTFYETDNRVKRYAETLFKTGKQVDVISLKRNNQQYYESISGVNVYRIQERTINEKGKLSYAWRLLKFLMKSSIMLTKNHLKAPYDLIHVHNVPDFLVFASFIPKLRGAKIVLDIHDILPEFYASKFNVSKKSFAFKTLLWIEKLSTSFAHHVIIGNHLWYKTLISRSVEEDKCTVILNYPDPSVFYRHRRNVNGKRKLVIYPGTLNYHQGLDIAVKAFALIKDKVPEVDFHIYGEGPSKETLCNMIADYNLEDRVVLKKYLHLEAIAEVMSTAELGVVPKRSSSFGDEAFSTKTLEFMALGVPIIVSDTKIDRYYFNDQLVMFFESGNEKDLAQKMLLLIKNKNERDRLVTNSLSFIKDNNWNAKKEIYLNLVFSLTGVQHHG